MILADIHTHTSFSGDSDEPMENQIRAAIEKGLSFLCFTEHMDIDYPDCEDEAGNIFLLDTASYLTRFEELRNQYRNHTIQLLFGVELGLQPHLVQTHNDYIKQYPFDFIIGSEHITNKRDPYYPSFYEGRTEFEAYSEYFEDIIRNIDLFSDFDTFGHLDYVVRYGPNTNKDYSYSKYGDYIDEILKRLINKGIGLEANTGGYKYGLGCPNPSKEILIRYRELGGELLTIGSDAHDTSRIAADFDKLESLLLECGYKYYTIFKNRKPEFISFN